MRRSERNHGRGHIHGGRCASRQRWTLLAAFCMALRADRATRRRRETCATALIAGPCLQYALRVSKSGAADGDHGAHIEYAVCSHYA